MSRDYDELEKTYGSEVAEFMRQGEARVKRLAKKRKAGKIKPPSEHDIQKQILAWLDLCGIFAYRQNSQGNIRVTGQGTAVLTQSQTRGIPDIVGVLHDGRALYIEVKRPNWNPPSQEAMDKAHTAWVKTGKKDPYDTHRYQQAFQAKAARAGALVIVARCLEDVTETISAYIRQAER